MERTSADLSDLVSAAKKLGEQAEDLDRRLTESMQQAQQGAAKLETKLCSVLDEHTVNLEEDFQELSTKSKSRSGSDLLERTESDLQELLVAAREYQELNDKIMHKMTRLEAELERLSAQQDEYCCEDCRQRELQALRAAPPAAPLLELEVAALRTERDQLLGQNCGLVAKVAELEQLGGSLCTSLSHSVSWWLSHIVAL